MNTTRLLCFATACVIACTSLPAAAGLTGPMQSQVRKATFEIVMKKPETDSLGYEKPLPLELLPFRERNDKYVSIGTAFAIGSNRFVTAAHAGHRESQRDDVRELASVGHCEGSVGSDIPLERERSRKPDN